MLLTIVTKSPCLVKCRFNGDNIISLGFIFYYTSLTQDLK